MYWHSFVLTLYHRFKITRIFCNFVSNMHLSLTKTAQVSNKLKIYNGTSV